MSDSKLTQAEVDQLMAEIKRDTEIQEKLLDAIHKIVAETVPLPKESK